MMGHQGENKTFAKIAEFFDFPGMREEISRYVSLLPNMSAVERTQSGTELPP